MESVNFCKALARRKRLDVLPAALSVDYLAGLTGRVRHAAEREMTVKQREANREFALADRRVRRIEVEARVWAGGKVRRVKKPTTILYYPWIEVRKRNNVSYLPARFPTSRPWKAPIKAKAV